MNSNQKLRYIINLYGEKIGIPNLYKSYKEKILKISKADQLNEKKKTEIIGSFTEGMYMVDMLLIDKEGAKNNMLERLK